MSEITFLELLEEFGLSQDVADKLKDGKICSARELACSDTSKLSRLVDSNILNTVLPVFHKFKLRIVMSKRPNKEALDLLRQHSVHEGGESLVDGRTASDAMSFVDDSSTLRTTSFQNHLSEDKRTPEASKSKPQSISVNINGGNMVQPNILGTATYSNQNVVIKTTIFQDTREARIERRSRRIEPTTILVNGKNVSTSDLQFVDDRDYWLDDIKVPPTPDQAYERHLKDNTVYTIKPRKSGRALIINNVNFVKNKRLGADVDTVQLKDVLQTLGFEVEFFEDKKQTEIKQIIHEFTTSVQSQPCSATVVFIGSHGCRENHQDCFLGLDQKLLPIKDVISQFTASACPGLKGKPKLFFLQFCRLDHKKGTSASAPTGDQETANADVVRETTQSVAGPHGGTAEALIPQNEADMLVSFATAAGTKGYRDVQYGSWYVTALCKILKEKANSEDILSMLTMVNEAVMANRAQEKVKGKKDMQVLVQMAELKSTLTKKVKFFP